MCRESYCRKKKKQERYMDDEDEDKDAGKEKYGDDEAGVVVVDEMC